MSKRTVKPQRWFFPQPVYLIGCFSEDGLPNLTLKTRIAFCSAEPPAIAVVARNALLKKTASRILETGIFSASLVTARIVEAADYCGSASGRDTDKCLDTGLTWTRGAVLDVPIVDQSPWAYECRVTRTVVYGDGTMFLGRVENIMADDSVGDPTLGAIDVLTMQPIVFAPGGYYSLGPLVYHVGASLQERTRGRGPA